MSEIVIGGRAVGEGHVPLIIAEIGINHGGSLELAKQMATSAIKAGAEIIKHQTHIIDDEMTLDAKQVIPGNASESIYDIMERCALGFSDEKALKKHVEDLGAIFLSTPFSRAAVDRLEELGVVAYKIGSGECNNYPLVEYIASKKKPVILSTGMRNIEEISVSVDILKKNNIPFALLHCTNVYPTPPDLVRLNCMDELRSAFPDAVVGLSDHSIGNFATIGAMAMGASIVERHFTDSLYREGPDISCSMTPNELLELKQAADFLFRARKGGKHAVAEEEPTIAFANASVVTVRDVLEGEVFTEENLWVKRPGSGDFQARDYKSLLGKTASRFVRKDKMVEQGDVVGAAG